MGSLPVMGPEHNSPLGNQYHEQEEIKMAKLTTAEFIEAIKELSVLELNDLV